MSRPNSDVDPVEMRLLDDLRDWHEGRGLFPHSLFYRHARERGDDATRREIVEWRLKTRVMRRHLREMAENSAREKWDMLISMFAEEEKEE